MCPSKNRGHAGHSREGRGQVGDSEGAHTCPFFLPFYRVAQLFYRVAQLFYRDAPAVVVGWPSCFIGTPPAVVVGWPERARVGPVGRPEAALRKVIGTRKKIPNGPIIKKLDLLYNSIIRINK